MTRAYTLGHPRGYERAVRTPGNAKAPGGYAFPDRASANGYRRRHPAETAGYRIYAMELPGPFLECVTASYDAAARARHAWHTSGDDAVAHMPACGVCRPRDIGDEASGCWLLLVPAPLINPDTGRPA